MSFQNMPANVLNELFVNKADSPDDREKLAAAGAAYIRDKLKELSFARKILPPKGVTVAECQRSLEHDTVYKIVDIEPGSYAMSISFRGEPDPKLIKGPRMAVTFHTISSLKWEGFTEELRTYTYPITDVIKNNVVKDIQAVEDRYFLLHVNSAVVQKHTLTNGAIPLRASDIQAGLVVEDSIAKGELARAAVADDDEVHPLQRQDIGRLSKLFTRAGKALRLDRVLMTEHTFQDFGQLTSADLGEKLTGEVMVQGYKYNTVLGYKIVTSLKGDVLNDSLIYGFTSPEFFGRSYILDNVKFWVKKEARKISFWGWENIGMGLANIAAVCRLELISGDTTGYDLAGYADEVAPGAEEDLGAVNNQAYDGYTYPQITLY